MWVVWLQLGVIGLVQSASTLHAPAGAQAPLALHIPERHTVAPLATVQGPSPLAYPHLLSAVSHTPLVHTSVPAATVHVPLSVGLACGGSLGTAVAFGSFAVHVCVLSAHHWPAEQSASTLQPPAGSHVPFVLHAPERHTVPPLAIVHGPSPLAYPHLLSAVSHTPLEHTSVPAAAVHVPLSVGFVCGASLGTAVPFGSFAVQAFPLSLHQKPAEHCVSSVQPICVMIWGPSSDGIPVPWIA
jgi:hypothetical protein